MQEQKRIIRLPHAGIVVLVGPSNSGKTTLLQRMIDQGTLMQTEVVSSDQFRILVGDEVFMDWRNRPKQEADVVYNEYQLISDKAFAAMDMIVGMRCRVGKLTVVDATHLHAEDRKKYVDMAAKYHVSVMAIALDVAEDELLRRDESRDNPRGRQRVKQQVQIFKRSVRGLKEEGFASSYMIKGEQVDQLAFIRKENPVLFEVEAGIDIIGDIHGCYQEMLELVNKLGYQSDEDGYYKHPNGRKLVSVGDVMSRGPQSILAIEFWRSHVEAGLAYMVDSNHGWKIARYLDGKNVSLGHGDERMAAELAQYERDHGKDSAEKLKAGMRQFLLAAPSHLVFCRNGVRQVVVAHAGIRDSFIGKQSKSIQDYCRYGDTAGMDDQGKPIRKDWFIEHESGELIVWGHDPRPQPTIIKHTVNIDQGVVFGGQLTAYRYPEKEFVSVSAVMNYSGDPDNPLLKWERKRFSPPNLRKFIEGYTVLTEPYGEISVRGEFVKAAVDSVSHYTVPIEELVYIPPTMSPPPRVSDKDDYLEHPGEAFSYYRSKGVMTMVAEKKHMGSRAILLLFRDREAAVKYVGREMLGAIYTRTGRHFFDSSLEEEILQRLNNDLQRAQYFNKHQTDFILLDAEIVPWNLKARELIASQYAHVAEAAIMDRKYIMEKLQMAHAAGRDVQDWIGEFGQKLDNAELFEQAFQKYCWDTNGLQGIQIAPFHTLAHSTEAFFDKSHVWHMQKNSEFAACSEMFIETEYRVITDETSEQEVIRWWEEMTEDGHEGIVVKPETFVMKHQNRLIQPGIKVRGRKYLHIIYGIDYLMPENLKRLKQRKTGKKERHALMEFALSVESVERFVWNEPVERIHECVLAVLSLESDPVDPRL
nr:polynucleotide kinase-phosphatase [Paenibacillus eucommiae]